MSNNQERSCRLNRVGGQAVIEGVMMKNGQEVALAVRKEDGTIEIDKSQFVALKTKHKWLNIPILRGIIGFFESMVLSFKTLGKSTDMLGLDEEDEKIKAERQAKKEAKRKEKLAKKGIEIEEKSKDVDEKPQDVAENEEKKEEKRGSGATTVVMMVFSLILGLGLALFLFSALPTMVTELLCKLFSIDKDGNMRYLLAGVEGVIKILIFIIYLASVTLMKDIRRTFQYHGAEHKSIACFESGMDLTPENARKCTRFHPRCGTSFMFVMILLGVIVGMFIPQWGWVRIVIKIALMPVIMGVGYEFIMFAGKHENWLTKALSAPGLWMQRITTKEPDDNQLAIAICAIKASMPEEFPDFDPSEYFITREENKGHLCIFEDKKSKKEKEKAEN
ncbi:MAG: DUF1385 domain-containing protein [Clostridia bacterium]|nr:DUF1385 domain-containing protein [Clostridia bacterium]